MGYFVLMKTYGILGIYEFIVIELLEKPMGYLGYEVCSVPLILLSN
jgi:hypothetical protein